MPYGTNAPPGAGVLVIMPRDNPAVADPEQEPFRYKLGEVLRAEPVEGPWSWVSIPQNYIGEFTVEQLNSRPLASHTLYETARVTNAGTLTNGEQTTDVEAGDSVAWTYPGYWKNYGVQEDRPPFNRLHIIIEDRSAEAVQVYLERYNLKVSLQTVAGPDPEGLRRIEVSNLRRSQSGKLSFEDEQTQNVVTEWNEKYPESELFRVSWNETIVTYQGKFTEGQRQEFEDTIIAESARRYQDQRRWYVPASDVQQIANAGGFVSGPAANVTIRDRLLD